LIEIGKVAHICIFVIISPPFQREPGPSFRQFVPSLIEIGLLVLEIFSNINMVFPVVVPPDPHGP
jgi:hypothetical protein